MIRIALQHGFQSCNNLIRAHLRRAIVMPKSPRMQIHARFRKQRSRIQVVGVVLHQLTHRVTIFFRRLLQIRLRVRWKAFRHRGNIFALARRGICRQTLRLHNFLVSLLEAVFAGGIVVVRPYRLGDAPMRHRQRGVQLRRALKRARRFIMVESVNVAQPLVEKLLRFRVHSRHRMVLLADPAHQCRGFHGGSHVVRMLRQGASTQRSSQNEPSKMFHRTLHKQKASVTHSPVAAGVLAAGSREPSSREPKTHKRSPPKADKQQIPYQSTPCAAQFSSTTRTPASVADVPQRNKPPKPSATPESMSPSPLHSPRKQQQSKRETPYPRASTQFLLAVAMAPSRILRRE